MPRRTMGRTMTGETALAERIVFERQQRGLGYDALAKLLTDAGCPIAGSALLRIEKGEPRRRVTVDELLAFAAVFEVDDPMELLQPIELLRSERAKEIVPRLYEHLLEFEAAAVHGIVAYAEYAALASSDPDLLEFMNHHIDSDREARAARGAEAFMQVPTGATEEELIELHQRIVSTWDFVVRIGVKASGANIVDEPTEGI